MQKHRLKIPLLAVCALLVFAGTAQAHTSAAVVTCSDTTVNFTKFANYGTGNGSMNTVHYKITTHGDVVKDGTASFSGVGTSVTVPNPLFNGDVVAVRTSWASSETRDGHAKADSEIKKFTAVDCGERPHPGISVVKDGPATAVVNSQATFTYAVTNTGDVKLDGPSVVDDKCATVTKVENGDASFDPGDTWNYTCTVTITADMGTDLHNTVTACGTGSAPNNPCDTDDHHTTITPPETPPVTPPTVVPPGSGTPTTPPAAGGVLPETIASGRAQLRGPSGCAKQAFTARVSGRSIATVSFYLDGKLFKKFTSTKTTYSIKVNPRRHGFGRHRIVAKVTFLAASGTKSQSMRLTFRRCAQGAVAPQFTG